jgi:hypothetical protein
MEGSTERGFHMGRREYFTASGVAIASGQAISRKENCHIPPL